MLGIKGQAPPLEVLHRPHRRTKAVQGARVLEIPGESAPPTFSTVLMLDRLDTHYRWVIMLVIVVVAIVGGWIAACLLRRRYIRRKEKEIEMRPPVAWGPHQMQGMTGGYDYGDGVADSSKAGKSHAGALNKEIGAVATPAHGKRESKGWLKKNRN